MEFVVSFLALRIFQSQIELQHIIVCSLQSAVDRQTMVDPAVRGRHIL
jgi:hypothetical protein